MGVDATLLLLLFVGILIATYRDIRVREVPDLVCYGLLAIGVLTGLAMTLITLELRPFVEHALGAAIGICIGLAMTYTRQWGGGDAKLLMGVGAILGAWSDNWRIAIFLVFLIGLGALYGIIYTLGLALAHRKKFVVAFKERIRAPKVHRARIALVITGIALLIAAIFVESNVRVLIGFLLLGMYLLTYAWIAIGAVEQGILTKEYPVGRLTEGDWLAQDVVVRRKVLISKKNIGLTLEDIAAIKKAKVKSVIVREGIPFVPSFLLALLALLLIEYLAAGNAVGVLLGL